MLIMIKGQCFLEVLFFSNGTYLLLVKKSLSVCEVTHRCQPQACHHIHQNEAIQERLDDLKFVNSPFCFGLWERLHVNETQINSRVAVLVADLCLLLICAYC